MNIFDFYEISKIQFLHVSNISLIFCIIIRIEM